MPPPKAFHELLIYSNGDSDCIASYFNFKRENGRQSVPVPSVTKESVGVLSKILQQCEMSQKAVTVVILSLEELLTNIKIVEPWQELATEVSEVLRRCLSFLVKLDPEKNAKLFSKLCDIASNLAERKEPLCSSIFNNCAANLLNHVFRRGVPAALKSHILDVLCLICRHASFSEISHTYEEIAPHLRTLARLILDFSSETQVSAYGVLIKAVTDKEQAKQKASSWFVKFPELQKKFVDCYMMSFREGSGLFVGKLFEISRPHDYKWFQGSSAMLNMEKLSRMETQHPPTVNKGTSEWFRTSVKNTSLPVKKSVSIPNTLEGSHHQLGVTRTHGNDVQKVRPKLPPATPWRQERKTEILTTDHFARTISKNVKGANLSGADQLVPVLESQHFSPSINPSINLHSQTSASGQDDQSIINLYKKNVKRIQTPYYPNRQKSLSLKNLNGKKSLSLNKRALEGLTGSQLRASEIFHQEKEKGTKKELEKKICPVAYSVERRQNVTQSRESAYHVATTTSESKNVADDAQMMKTGLKQNKSSLLVSNVPGSGYLAQSDQQYLKVQTDSTTKLNLGQEVSFAGGQQHIAHKNTSRPELRDLKVANSVKEPKVTALVEFYDNEEKEANVETAKCSQLRPSAVVPYHSTVDINSTRGNNNFLRDSRKKAKLELKNNNCVDRECTYAPENPFERKKLKTNTGKGELKTSRRSILHDVSEEEFEKVKRWLEQQTPDTKEPTIEQTHNENTKAFGANIFSKEREHKRNLKDGKAIDMKSEYHSHDVLDVNGNYSSKYCVDVKSNCARVEVKCEPHVLLEDVCMGKMKEATDIGSKKTQGLHYEHPSHFATSITDMRREEIRGKGEGNYLKRAKQESKRVSDNMQKSEVNVTNICPKNERRLRAEADKARVMKDEGEESLAHDTKDGNVNDVVLCYVNTNKRTMAPTQGLEYNDAATSFTKSTAIRRSCKMRQPQPSKPSVSNPLTYSPLNISISSGKTKTDVYSEKRNSNHLRGLKATLGGESTKTGMVSSRREEYFFRDRLKADKLNEEELDYNEVIDTPFTEKQEKVVCKSTPNERLKDRKKRSLYSKEKETIDISQISVESRGHTKFSVKFSSSKQPSMRLKPSGNFWGKKLQELERSTAKENRFQPTSNVYDNLSFIDEDAQPKPEAKMKKPRTCKQKTSPCRKAGIKVTKSMKSPRVNKRTLSKTSLANNATITSPVQLVPTSDMLFNELLSSEKDDKHSSVISAAHHESKNNPSVILRPSGKSDLKTEPVSTRSFTAKQTRGSTRKSVVPRASQATLEHANSAPMEQVASPPAKRTRTTLVTKEPEAKTCAYSRVKAHKFPKLDLIPVSHSTPVATPEMKDDKLETLKPNDTSANMNIITKKCDARNIPSPCLMDGLKQRIETKRTGQNPRHDSKDSNINSHSKANLALSAVDVDSGVDITSLFSDDMRSPPSSIAAKSMPQVKEVQKADEKNYCSPDAFKEGDLNQNVSLSGNDQRKHEAHQKVIKAHKANHQLSTGNRDYDQDISEALMCTEKLRDIMRRCQDRGKSHQETLQEQDEDLESACQLLCSQEDQTFKALIPAAPLPSGEAYIKMRGEYYRNNKDLLKDILDDSSCSSSNENDKLFDP